MKITTKEYVDNQMKWMMELHKSSIESVRLAVDKVQEDYKYYKEQQNEWRQQIKDQTSTYVTRRELTGAIIAIITISVAIAGVIVAWIMKN